MDDQLQILQDEANINMHGFMPDIEALETRIRYLKNLAGVSHERHQAVREWIEGSFSYAPVKAEKLAQLDRIGVTR